MIALMTLLLACSPDPTAPAADTGAAAPTARGDCNPVDDAQCLLPFPSDFYTRDDPATPTGVRLDFGPSSLPINVDDLGIDPAPWNRRDGFSTLGSAIAHMPGASLNGVVGHADIGAYRDDDARTVLLDARTGERLPHFVEREAAAAGTGRDLLILRPAVPIAHETQVVVGIRGLVDDAGALVDAPAGFAALRDGAGGDDPDLARQRALYEDRVFPTLDAAGFDRSSLQLAWTYTVGSAEVSLADMRYLRDDALARVGDAGPAYTILDLTEGACDGGQTIWRTIEGEMQAPLYLEDWSPGSVMARDADGQPQYNGDVAVPFTVRVPCSVVLDPSASNGVLQYAHGLFGTRSEAYSGTLARIANDHGLVIVAVDMTGMKNVDAAQVALVMVTNPGGFVTVPERTMQGLVEHLSAVRLMTGDLAQDDALLVDGESVVNTQHVYFHGNSQGAVIGAGYVALSPDIERAVYGVPGTPFTLLLPRAVGFQPFLVLLETMYDDWADITVFMAIMQLVWDPAESAGYTAFMGDKGMEDGWVGKPALMQAAIGDASVPTLGAHILARAHGAALLSPSPRDVWGLEPATAPVEGSVLVEYDFGVVEEPTSLPATDEEHNPHNAIYGAATSSEQIGVFLETGVVVQTCDGACDPD